MVRGLLAHTHPSTVAISFCSPYDNSPTRVTGKRSETLLHVAEVLRTTIAAAKTVFIKHEAVICKYLHPRMLWHITVKQDFSRVLYSTRWLYIYPVP